MLQLNEFFRDQYGLNTLASDNVLMMYTLTTYIKDKDDLVLLVDELNVKDEMSLKTDLPEIIQALNKETKREVTLVMVNVKVRNKKKSELMSALLKAEFVVHSSEAEKIVFRKQIPKE